jgi:glycosyltransferase A (GT-A) superfamily protein (DUF2064 family)
LPTPALLVMASAARGGDGLVAAIGDQRSATLRRTLMGRLLSWATEVAPGAVHLADPAEGPAEAATRALGSSDRPLLIAWPDLPRWRPDHAAAALGDLDAGCELSLGPVFDGGFYLVAFAHPLAALPTLPDEAWHGADSMAIALTAAHRAGVEAGLLRAERGLHSPEDVRAALADPLLDAELRSLLDPRA